MMDNVADAVRELRHRLAAIEANRTAAATFRPARGNPILSQPESAGTAPAGTESAGTWPFSTEPAGTAEAQAQRDEAQRDPVQRDPVQRDEEQRDEEQIAKAMCLRLLSDAAHPRAGLEQKLLRRGISQVVVTRILDRFTDLGLIDDQSYAEAYVRSKHRERALARSALAAELRRRGVEDGIAVGAVDIIDREAEEVRAAALVAKRVRAAMAAGPEAARRRLLALLDRRGYPAEMSIQVVDAALAAAAESAED
jgi:regulatory protein